MTPAEILIPVGLGGLLWSAALPVLVMLVAVPVFVAGFPYMNSHGPNR
jgi:hypothetical protein